MAGKEQAVVWRKKTVSKFRSSVRLSLHQERYHQLLSCNTHLLHSQGVSFTPKPLSCKTSPARHLLQGLSSKHKLLFCSTCPARPNSCPASPCPPRHLQQAVSYKTKPLLSPCFGTQFPARCILQAQPLVLQRLPCKTSPARCHLQHHALVLQYSVL